MSVHEFSKCCFYSLCYSSHVHLLLFGWNGKEDEINDERKTEREKQIERNYYSIHTIIYVCLACLIALAMLKVQVNARFMLRIHVETRFLKFSPVPLHSARKQYSVFCFILSDL